MMTDNPSDLQSTLNRINLLIFLLNIFSESYEENDHLFESLVALEEFCKELAAIAFVKYHHATE